ncbi:MAG: hypothetical protein OQK35_03875, partial [Alphaproteobacteria bacterium]|nr:hypothetical protein [Alphaproteobacteria bacterium]
KNIAQSFPEQWVIINNKDSNHFPAPTYIWNHFLIIGRLSPFPHKKGRRNLNEINVFQVIVEKREPKNGSLLNIEEKVF